MIDFNDGGLDALAVPRKCVCRTCGQPKSPGEFGYMRGKLKSECLVCSRARWTSNRRVKLERRKCLRCKLRLPFASFPDTVRNGKTRLGMICTPCDTARRLEVRAENHGGGTVAVDFTVIAQQMVTGPKGYHQLSFRDRRKIYVIARELARQFSPYWRELFDADESPLDRVGRPWAARFIDAARQAGTLPAALTEYIAAQAADVPKAA